MSKFTVLFLAACFSCFGQQFMPEPLPQVEYVGGLPSWKVDVYQVDGKSVPDKPSDHFATGSAPQGHMIILQHVDPKPPDASTNNVEKTMSPEVFYLQDNIWNESKRILEKYYEPPLNIVFVLNLAKDIAQHNKVRVPAWKLEGVILDTKMPKDYKLKYPAGLP